MSKEDPNPPQLAAPSIERKLDLVSLQLFSAICFHGSLGKAARNEYIAPSALSKRISDLEHAIGTPVFYRDSGGVRLTPAGEMLHSHVAKIMKDVESMRRELHQYVIGGKGEVRIAASGWTTIQFLPEDLVKFTTTHSDIDVILQEGRSWEVIRSVRTGTADIGLCPEPLIEDELERRLYRRDTLVLAVPRGHPLAALTEVPFADCLAYDHVVLQGSSTLLSLVNNAAASVGTEVRARLHVGSLEAMCRMVVAGIGVAVIPDQALTETARDNGVVLVRIAEDWAARNVYVYAKSFESLPKAAKLMVDVLCGPDTY